MRKMYKIGRYLYYRADCPWLVRIISIICCEA